MTFQPVVPLPGIAGWAFLQNTLEDQVNAFNRSPSIQRDVDYFRENANTLLSARDLIADRRLLSVALSAFGLSEDINNRAFLERILEDGTDARDALANRLADSRYRAFSEALGFGPNQIPAALQVGFTDRITALYEAQEFEAAIGNQDETMRVALYAQRELASVASNTENQDAQWFRVMGQPPLRQFMETALGLPSSIGQIDIDRQLEIFQDKARQSFDTDDLSALVEPQKLEDLTNAYLARAQINSFGSTASSGSIALALLSNSRI